VANSAQEKRLHVEEFVRAALAEEETRIVMKPTWQPVFGFVFIASA
jgi:hypothetical protein